VRKGETVDKVELAKPEEAAIVSVSGGRLVEWSGQLCMTETPDGPGLQAAYKDAARRSEIWQAERAHKKAKEHVRREIRLAAKHLRSYHDAIGIVTVAELKPRVKWYFESFIREIAQYESRTYRNFKIYDDKATIGEIVKAIIQLNKREFATKDELYSFFEASCKRFRSSVRKYKPTPIR
jgi:hypothetical protein